MENSAPTARIFMGIFRKSVEKIKVLLESDQNTGYFRLTWTSAYIYNQHIAEFFLELETTKAEFVEKTKTLFLWSVTFLSEDCTIYEIRWKNTVEPGRPQITI